MRFLILSGLLLVPSFAFAAEGLKGVLDVIGDLIGLATPIVVALALLYFFWGLAQYILSQGSEEKKKDSKNIMIWGILALFIMVSVWGIVNVVRDTFELTDDTIIVPTVPNVGNQ